MDNIEINRKNQLKLLNEKYAKADLAKKSFSYITFICIILFYSIFILNDLFNIFSYYYNINRNTSKISGNPDLESTKIDMNNNYSEKLEKRLENFHISLIKSINKRNNNNDF